MVTFRNKFSGCTVQAPDAFAQDHGHDYWGLLGPYTRTYPDGTVEHIDWRTTVLKRSQWELVP